ncbi:MAG: VWA domain-containing protein [Spirochaetales bacterium]|nr:VWA domain-containing protein [Spirochaetales bacterium]
MIFANPNFLYLLAVIPIIIAYHIWRGRKSDTRVKISSLESFAAVKKPFRWYLREFLFAIRILAFGILIVVLARPQSANEWEQVNSEGIDIVMCMDISGSMQARDFSPNRLDAAKDVASQFINGRPGDRFAIVVFSAESFTQCPLTSDKATVLNLMREIKFGMVDDGTAIGMGLATSVNRLKDSKAKSKVVILLTDGVNNSGMISPLTAADIASQYNIRVYTIGVGTTGTAPMPVNTVFGTQLQDVKVEIDEDVLRKIAEKTGGQYFRATDNAKLAEIYKEIDKLEKTILNVQKFSKRKDEYFVWLFAAVLLLFSEILIRNIFLRNTP